ncbi:methyltransferase [Lancefieldella parvula DSM 20469]|uniref:Methyltransferase n=1 Tax=Lancefieldella parvula (strain ATCC 33793 / DSM 20469 / CCUG 32760 / JCM 10300 / KCTC 3663 / VPI 0546 / 1246) TaxID=521095 RepID=C8W748_LANP1|nr:16S rRNA (guanine(966)-N(2))-methyltransferase RsmD [Lancefieldella parvula]ACV51288.1 methyltransferase [Lancefieldella parvula DSM 20469]
MRIIGGKWKGRVIEAPDGKGITRPTTDRTREAIASSILASRGLDISESRVLDAFAGSGAMGFELLSRGALYATFVDKDRKTCDRIKRTAKSLGVANSEMSVICGDTARLAESSQLFGAPFDVVILDPPYAVEVEVVSKLLKDLIQSESLTNDAVVVYEHSYKTDSVSLDDFELSKSKRYGIAQVDVLVRCEG